MPLHDSRILVDDLMYPEGPRWNDGWLYVSDFFAHEVVRVDFQGRRETHVVLPDTQPSGLGWLPDGRILVVSMLDARLLASDGRSVSTVGDLGPSAVLLNDMVVDDYQRAYVGALPDVYSENVEIIDGFNAGRPPTGTQDVYLFDLSPHGAGKVAVVASGLRLPNGMAITPDGRTLIVAETLENRLLAFDIDDEGSLSRQRTWASLPGSPDGICLDAQGQVWVAIPLPARSGFIRVAEGGEITDHVESDWAAVACTFGGENRDHLCLVEIEVIGTGSAPALHTPGNGRIRVGRVDVPGAERA